MVDSKDSDKQDDQAKKPDDKKDDKASGQSDDGGMGLENFASKPAASPNQSAPEQAAPAVNDPSIQKEAVYDIPVEITAVIGSAIMPVSQLIRLGRGAVVPLDRKLGEAVDIYANNRLVAHGEVVVVDDNHIGVTMTEILSSSSSSGDGSDD